MVIAPLPVMVESHMHPAYYLALDFLNIYQRMIPPIQKKTSMLAHYLLELALQEYQFLKYLPSVVATCCLSMAMYTIDGFPMVRLKSSLSAAIVPDLTLNFVFGHADEGTRRCVSVRLG